MLMLALYRGGRQAESLEVYQNTYRLLLSELGIRPGPELQRLHQRILQEDPDLLLPQRPGPWTRLPNKIIKKNPPTNR